MFNLIIELGVYFIIILSPMAFGAVDSWAWGLCAGGCFFLYFIFSLQCLKANPGNASSTFHPPWLKLPGSAWLAVFFLVILLQLKSWSLDSLAALMPWGWQVFYDTIPGWPVMYQNARLSLWPAGTWAELIKFLAYIALFLVVARNFTERERLKRFGVILLLAGALQLLWAGGRFFLKRKNALPNLSWPYLDFPPGTFNLSDHLAIYLALVCGIAWGLFYYRYKHGRPRHHSEHRRDTFQISIFFVVLFLVAAPAVVFFAGSQVGIYSLLIAPALFYLIKSKTSKPIRLILLILVVAAIMFFSFPGKIPIAPAIPGEDWSVLNAREFVDAPLTKIIRSAPWLGLGGGAFVRYFHIMQPPPLADMVVLESHNGWLELLADLGIIGFLALALGALLFIRRHLRLIKERRDLLKIGIVAGGLTSFMLFLLLGLTGSGGRLPANALLMAAILGAVEAANRKDRHHHQKDVIRSARFRLWSGLIALGILFPLLLSFSWAAKDLLVRRTEVLLAQKEIPVSQSQKYIRLLEFAARMPALDGRPDIMAARLYGWRANRALLERRSPDAWNELWRGENLLSRALMADPLNFEIAFYRGYLLGLRSRIENPKGNLYLAQDSFKQAVLLNPASSWVPRFAAEFLEGLGSPSLALPFIRQLTYVVPYPGRNPYLTPNGTPTPERFSGVIEGLHQAKVYVSRIFPARLPELWCAEANFYRQLGHDREAGRVLAEARRQFPIHPCLIFQQAMLHFQYGQNDSAWKLLESLPPNNPYGDEARNYLIRNYLNQGDTAKAMPLLAQLLESNPQNSAYLFLLCRLRLQLGELNNAQEAFLAALKLERKYSPEVNSIIELLLLQNRQEEALRFLAAGQQDGMLAEPAEAIPFLFKQAAIYLARGQKGELENAYRKLTTLAQERGRTEDAIRAYSALAQFYLQQHEELQAQAVLNEGILSYPQSQELISLLNLLKKSPGN